MKGNPKVLLVDLETAPSLGFVWGKWQQNVIEFKEDGYLLSIAWKWLGSSATHSLALNDFADYVPGAPNDAPLADFLWDLFDKADVIIAHNGDNFDIKTANARFVVNELPPPSPYQTIDTLKLARRHFRFASNSLDDLGRHLNIGRKLQHSGKGLWLACMEGDKRAFSLMKRYNKQDVVLLEKVYHKIRSWTMNHPNLNVLSGKSGSCPICQSRNLQKRGYSMTRVSRKQRYQCMDCAAWSTGTPEKMVDIR